MIIWFLFIVTSIYIFTKLILCSIVQKYSNFSYCEFFVIGLDLFWDGQYEIVMGVEVVIDCTSEQIISKKIIYLPVCEKEENVIFFNSSVYLGVKVINYE